LFKLAREITMAHQLGSVKTAPRSYVAHLRHGGLGRVRHAQQFTKFLSTQATRLSSTSVTVFGKVKKYTAARVKAAVNLAAIP
jgi:hypothetical protein